MTLGVGAMAKGLGDRAWCHSTHMTLADIAVGCALSYLNFRFSEIDWRSEYPNLTKLLDKLDARPSFGETLPEVVVSSAL